MKKILISCIGNRNITYQGNYIDEHVRQHKLEDYLITLPNGRKVADFKAFTQWLLTHYEEEKANIALQIINHPIEQYQQEISEIVLVITQQEGHFQYQDTLYEGALMQKLIQAQYGLPVTLIEYSGNPIDEDQIVDQISPSLKALIATHQETAFIYNDAGGTPQLKAMLKELLAYYLPAHYFQVVYANQHDEVSDKKRLYAKRYALLKVARAFVQRYDYQGALGIIQQISEALLPQPDLIIYLQVAAARLNFEHRSVQQTLLDPASPKVIRKNRLLQTYAQRKLPEGVEMFPKDYSNYSQHNIFEIASICQLYFSLERYTLGVATYYRLCEEVCDNLIEDQYGYRLEKRAERDRFAEEHHSFLKKKYKNINRFTLFSRMAFVSEHGSKHLKKLGKLMMKTNSNFKNSSSQEGIDSLRNHCFLAHKNQPVTQAMIEENCPGFLTEVLPGIFHLLQLPEKNIYAQMNDDLHLLFMQE